MHHQRGVVRKDGEDTAVVDDDRANTRVVGKHHRQHSPTAVSGCHYQRRIYPPKVRAACPSILRKGPIQRNSHVLDRRGHRQRLDRTRQNGRAGQGLSGRDNEVSVRGDFGEVGAGARHRCPRSPHPTCWIPATISSSDDKSCRWERRDPPPLARGNDPNPAAPRCCWQPRCAPRSAASSSADLRRKPHRMEEPSAPPGQWPRPG
jgi:hypothetical protein